MERLKNVSTQNFKSLNIENNRKRLTKSKTRKMWHPLEIKSFYMSTKYNKTLPEKKWTRDWIDFVEGQETVDVFFNLFN